VTHRLSTDAIYAAIMFVERGKVEGLAESLAEHGSDVEPTKATLRHVLAGHVNQPIHRGHPRHGQNLLVATIRGALGGIIFLVGLGIQTVFGPR
jgi:hypothetical protein